MVSYHHVQHQKKTNVPILKKPSDRRTDERTDRQIDRRTRVISQDVVGLTSNFQNRLYNLNYVVIRLITNRLQCNPYCSYRSQ